MFSIYKITNKKTGDFYIGYTSLPHQKRYMKHKHDKRGCPILRRAFNKYGFENFECILLSLFNDKEMALNEEIRLIAELRPRYNISAGGNDGQHLLGPKNGMYGKTHTDEHKLMMSRRMSGSNNHMFGSTHTPEARRKISQSRIGKPSWCAGRTGVYSAETIKKMSKPKTEQHKQNLRKVVLVDGLRVDNAKKFCQCNGHNYICFTQAAKRGKLYKGMMVKYEV